MTKYPTNTAAVAAMLFDGGCDTIEGAVWAPRRHRGNHGGGDHGGGAGRNSGAPPPWAAEGGRK